MGNRHVFEAFALAYVRPEFRDRFVHEAAKKPEKLLSRVCHTPADLFDTSLANGKCSYEPTEPCLVLSRAYIRGFRASSWAEAHRAMGLGDGLLVIGAEGRKFYAETEAMQGAPSVSYAAGS